MPSSVSRSLELSSSTLTGLFCPGRVDKMRGGKMATKLKGK